MKMDGIELKIGDKVYCLVYGWLKVVEIGTSTFELNDYRGNTSITYKYPELYLHGKGNVNRTIYWDDIKITPPPRPTRLEDLKIDQPVIVWSDRGIEYKRHFSGINSYSKKIMVFRDGRTSWSSGGTTHGTMQWDNWRLPTEEELK